MNDRSDRVERDLKSANDIVQQAERDGDLRYALTLLIDACNELIVIIKEQKRQIDRLRSMPI